MTRSQLPLLVVVVASMSGVWACGDDAMRVPAWHHASWGAGSSSGSQGTPGTGPGSSGAASSSGGGSGDTPGGGSSGGGGASSGSSSGAPPPTASFAVSLSKASLEMQLMAAASLTVSIAPNGFTGALQLAPSGLPGGVSAKFDPAALTLDGTTTVTASLAFTTDPSAAPGDAAIDVSATSPAGAQSATLALTVQPSITIHIPKGVDQLGGTLQNPVTDAYGPYPMQLKAPQGLSAQNPVTVYFMNDDDVDHEVHADAPSQGFGHDPGPFGPHSMDPYVRRVNSAGIYDFYLHDEGGPATIGRVVIQ
jgi:hypothetical protein